jgi:hypothetical protein
MQQRCVWLTCGAVLCCVVLCRAEQYGGRILVARESAAAPGKPGSRSTFSSTDDQPNDNPTGRHVAGLCPVLGSCS